MLHKDKQSNGSTINRDFFTFFVHYPLDACFICAKNYVLVLLEQDGEPLFTTQCHFMYKMAVEMQSWLAGWVLVCFVVVYFCTVPLYILWSGLPLVLTT